MTRAPGRRCRGRAAGLSLLELLMGVGVGSIVAALALLMLAQFLAEQRRLLLQLRLQQQLHAAAEWVVRDLRRAGHWAQADEGVARENQAARPNPYAVLEGAAPGEAAERLRLAWAASAARPAGVGDGVLAAEHAGVQWRQGRLSVQLGEGNWQPLTDPELLTVTAFELRLRQQPLDLERLCATPRPQGTCPAAGVCPPRLLQRAVELRIEARAVQDAAVTHALRSLVALRNDAVEGTCPQP